MRNLVLLLLTLAACYPVQPIPTPQSTSEGFLLAKYGLLIQGVSLQAYQNVCKTSPTPTCLKVSSEGEAIYTDAVARIQQIDEVVFSPACGEYGCINSPININKLELATVALQAARTQLQAKLMEQANE